MPILAFPSYFLHSTSLIKLFPNLLQRRFKLIISIRIRFIILILHFNIRFNSLFMYVSSIWSIVLHRCHCNTASVTDWENALYDPFSESLLPYDCTNSIILNGTGKNFRRTCTVLISQNTKWLCKLMFFIRPAVKKYYSISYRFRLASRK